MARRRRKIPQVVMREIQKQVGITDNTFVKHVDIANAIADIHGWPKIEGKDRARDYINRHLNKINEVSIKTPLAFVYFVQSGGFVKIGVATDIEKRMKALQTSNPHKLSLLAHIPAKSKRHAYEIETQLHKKFKGYKSNGEWFVRWMIPKMLDIKERVIWNGCNHAERMISGK